MTNARFKLIIGSPLRTTPDSGYEFLAEAKIDPKGSADPVPNSLHDFILTFTLMAFIFSFKSPFCGHIL